MGNFTLNLKNYIKSLVYDKTEIDSALNSKVDKITGKGLSTNDYTTNEKEKLGGVNVASNITTISSNLPTGWSGTLRIIKKNGWCLILSTNLKKTSVSTAWETLYSSGISNDVNQIIYDDMSNDVVLRIRANGDIQAKCIVAETEFSGCFSFPYSE